MRWNPHAGIGALLLAAGCATTGPPPSNTPTLEDLKFEAAQECAKPYPNIEVLARPDGVTVKQTRRSFTEWKEFTECYEAEIERRLASRRPSQGRLALAPSGPVRTVVPVTIRGGTAIVSVVVNGAYPVRLMLDTGAAFTTISPSAMQRIGVTVPPTAPRVTVVSAGGRRDSQPYVRVASLALGDVTVADIDIAVFDVFPNDPRLDGVLGNNFLRHFRVGIDHPRGLVLLDTGRPAPPPVAATVVSDREWPAPTWRPGDRWSFRRKSPTDDGTYERTVDGEATLDDVAHWVVKVGPRAYYYRKDPLALHFETENGTRVVQWTPPIGHAWPLRAGKSWDVTTRVETVGPRQTASRFWRCTAVDEPTVTVPAGTFATVHVVCSNRVGTVLFETWYAAEARTWVRERYASEDGDTVHELVGYTVR